MKLKVTIMGNDSPTYALQKALAITRTPALLDSVVEIYMGENTMSHLNARGQIIYKTHYLLLPAITILVKAIPAMQQLHTVHLVRMSVSRMELYSILSSPRLIHLILDGVRILKLNKFPPLKLCKLTLIAMSSWEGVEPLIGQLATSLEYLELRCCRFRTLRPSQLPPFPRLRELRHRQGCLHDTFNSASGMGELLQLGTQITHLYFSESFGYVHAATFPKSLRHLSVDVWVLTEHNFGACILHGLLSLSVRHCVLDKGLRGWGDIRLLHSLIYDCFPGITSLQLHIPWPNRNIAMAIARFQRNVQLLNLVIDTASGLHHEEKEPTRLDQWGDIPAAYICGSIMPGPLQSLWLEVTQTRDDLGLSVAPCTQWVESEVLPPVISVGGPNLNSIDVLFIQPESKVARERVLRREWVKSNTGNWEIDDSL